MPRIQTPANRIKFTRMVKDLFSKAEELGFDVALDYARRCKDCPLSYPTSFHVKGLAVDILLYKDGVYQKTTAAHKELGEWWESIGGTWGGRFKRPDGNHYSYLE